MRKTTPKSLYYSTDNAKKTNEATRHYVLNIFACVWALWWTVNAVWGLIEYVAQRNIQYHALSHAIAHKVHLNRVHKQISLIRNVYVFMGVCTAGSMVNVVLASTD